MQLKMGFFKPHLPAWAVQKASVLAFAQRRLPNCRVISANRLRGVWSKSQITLTHAAFRGTSTCPSTQAQIHLLSIIFPKKVGKAGLISTDSSHPKQRCLILVIQVVKTANGEKHVPHSNVSTHLRIRRITLWRYSLFSLTIGEI